MSKNEHNVDIIRALMQNICTYLPNIYYSFKPKIYYKLFLQFYQARYIKYLIVITLGIHDLLRKLNTYLVD